jgi:hypothetical protein
LVILIIAQRLLMLSALTKLPLPLPPLLGLLVATIVFSASARESLGDVTPLPENSPSITCLARPDMDGIATEETQHIPQMHQLPDGTIIITLNWNDNEGESVEPHSADLVLTSMPAPVASSCFIAGAQCPVTSGLRASVFPGSPLKGSPRSVPLGRHFPGNRLVPIA